MRLSLAIIKTRTCIFQIQSATSRGMLGSAIGTAFAIREDGLLVTAKHVVDSLSDPADLVVAYGLPPYNHQGVLKIQAAFVGIKNATIIATDDDNDLALIKLPRSLKEYKFQIGGQGPEISPTVSLLYTEEPEDGELIAVSGYPLNEPSLVTTSGSIASNWTLDNNFERYLGDITVNSGNSGGPAYRLRDGKILGVCVAYKTAFSTYSETGDIGDLSHNSGLTVIVPAQSIKDLVSKP